MKYSPVPINIKDVPYLLHKQFKGKCKDAGCSMTRVQIRLMEMIRDGEVVLEKSGDIRFRKEGEGQQEKMRDMLSLELASAFHQGIAEDAGDYVGVRTKDLVGHWECDAEKIVKGLCKI